MTKAEFLREHMATKHPEWKYDEAKMLRGESYNWIKVKCLKCGKILRKVQLNAHYSESHPEVNYRNFGTLYFSGIYWSVESLKGGKSSKREDSKEIEVASEGEPVEDGACVMKQTEVTRYGREILLKKVS